jgi:glyoxylase I family protein
VAGSAPIAQGIEFPAFDAAQTTEENDIMKARKASGGTSETAASARGSHEFHLNFHGVRYQTKDVTRSVDFYQHTLGFELEHQHLPQFATVSLGALKIHLSGPGASGSRQLPNGQSQEPGGWNRVVLGGDDLSACVEQLKQKGVRFRNELEVGPAGKQIQLEDPDGNPIELFEPARSKER